MSSTPITKAVSRSVKTLEALTIPKKLDAVRVEELRKESLKTSRLAEAIVVKDVDGKLGAEKFAKACSDYLKRVTEYFKPEVDARAEAKRQAEADRKELAETIDAICGPVKEALGTVDQKTRDFIRAENKRIEDENQKKLLAAQKAADEEKKVQIAELKDIDTPEARRAARELKAAPTVFAPVQLEQEIKATGGAVHREAWTCIPAREDALGILVTAAAIDHSLLIYLSVNQTALNAEARKSQEKFAVPGFRAVDQGATAHR